MTDARPATERGEARLGFLDAARGIAAATVVVQHAGELIWYDFGVKTHTVFNPGRFGVVVFFLVSGFIIPASFERLRGDRAGAVKQFWVGRFFRLYPLYWFSLAAIVLLSAFEHDAITDEFRSHLVVNTVGNATMLQELVGIPHAIGLYYTLTLEMLFYVTCSALFVLGLLRSSVRNAWVVIAVASVGGCVVPLVLDHRTPMAALFYVTSMFVGTVTYRWTIGEARSADLVAVVGATAVLGTVGSWINYVHFTDDEGGFAPFTLKGAGLPWLLAYLCFFGLLALRARRVPGVLAWLGRISYSLYLVHPLFVAMLHDGSNPWLSFATIVAAALVAASLTYRFIELPAQRVGKRMRARVAASA